MSFDATVYQNAAEVLALAVMNFACAIFAALEVVDGKRWLAILTNVKVKHNVLLDITAIQTAYKVEIGLSACVALFAIVFAYMSYAVTKEFGWKIYKKIGADISIQRMYRTVQFFVLALKIDIFIEFLVSVFYLIQFALKQGFHTWHLFLFIVITALMLPMLYFGRYAVASENPYQMMIFVFFQVCIVIQLVLIGIEAMQPGDYWYIWICFGKLYSVYRSVISNISIVILGGILAIVSAVLGLVCMTHFGKGLKPYIQRGENKEKVADNTQRNDQSWTIDEE
ncbi:hypothetical protein RMCBS344292_02368 [Rhizopus microsporus]|nr:hypothetical protein RMCBS344292_02368 [Rhizopus microsporus]